MFECNMIELPDLCKYSTSCCRVSKLPGRRYFQAASPAPNGIMRDLYLPAEIHRQHAENKVFPLPLGLRLTASTCRMPSSGPWARNDPFYLHQWITSATALSHQVA